MDVDQVDSLPEQPNTSAAGPDPDAAEVRPRSEDGTDISQELMTMEWVRRPIEADGRTRLLLLVGILAIIVLTMVAVTSFGSSGPEPGSALDDGIREVPTDSGREGLLTFRGNEQRSISALSKIPDDEPSLRWVFPQAKPLCSKSAVNGSEKTECGVGWTGQAALFPYAGNTWAVVGSYQPALNFLDLENGLPLRSIVGAADVYKGSPTIDPDGYPLVYAGATDGLLRIAAFDRNAPEILWQLDATEIDPNRPSNDWDASPVIHGDYLIEGGENGYLIIVKLNRGYGDDGLVTISPEVVFKTPTWTAELMGNVGPDAAFDVESSVAIYQEVVYVANSAGLIQGWKLDGLDDGKEPTKVFEWWIGDDVDATIVIDDAGKLYVAALHKLDTKQGQVMGQLIKLDPTLQMPVVWSAFTARRDGAPQDIIATPAIWQSVIIVSTFQGDILGFDLETGKELWRVAGEVTQLPSPVVFDQRLLQADCDGNLRAYNIGDGRKMPKLRWTMSIGQCIEATPALWNDWIVVGDRAGYIYGIGTEK
jgi:outer membrane protein assembly factor BamB